MCKAMEDMKKESLQEGIKEGAINTAKRMIEAGKYSLEDYNVPIDVDTTRLLIFQDYLSKKLKNCKFIQMHRRYRRQKT